jgi:hypothetical protein
MPLRMCRIPRIHLLPVVRRLRVALSWLLETGSEPGMDEVRFGRLVFELLR